MDRGKTQDLNGLWYIAPTSHELRRLGADPGLDHSDWAQVPVPGHWGSHLVAADSGPYLYRHRFETGEAAPDTRYWLHFDGVMSGAEVWLDGRFLGDIVGYFAGHGFEVTQAVTQRSEHLLALDVQCVAGGGHRADDRSNTSLTGALQTGLFASDRNPGGIWRPVSVRATGSVAIRHARVRCIGATETRAVLRIRLYLDSLEPTEVAITSTLARNGAIVAGTEAEHSLAGGENRLEFDVVVDRPERWWPASRGDQPLYDLTVSITDDGIESDTRQWRTGLRQVEMKNFRWSINGQPIFLKSIAYGPTTPFLGDLASDRLTADVEMARRAGFDMMRIFAHITRPEIYEAADRLGVVLWQDLPLIGGYSSKVRRATKIMIQQAVDQLGHHPSVVAWGGHVLPNGAAVEPPTTEIDDRPPAANRFVKRLARHITPTWNRGVLDPIVGRELRQADGSRPIITRSASLPSPTDPGGSDAFLWFGWRIGLAADFADMVRRWPRLAAFPGGIGSQSATEADWPLDSPTWAGAERSSFDQYVPRRAYGDGLSWSRATRAYQADLLETHVQILRRLKYRPTGGFCLFAFADSHPDGGFGLLDIDRRPKPAWDRMVEACRPVMALVESLPSTVVPGQPLAVAIHVVNDLPNSVDEAMVTAEVTMEGSDGTPTVVDRRAWIDSIEADSCAKVADVAFTTPASTGPLTVSVRLEANFFGVPLINTTTQRTIVIPQAESLSG